MIEMHWIWLLLALYVAMGAGSLLTFVARPERGWDGMFDLILLLLWPLLLIWTIQARRTKARDLAQRRRVMTAARGDILQALPDRNALPEWMDEILLAVHNYARYGTCLPQLQSTCNRESESLKADYPEVYSALKGTCVGCFLR